MSSGEAVIEGGQGNNSANHCNSDPGFLLNKDTVRRDYDDGEGIEGSSCSWKQLPDGLLDFPTPHNQEKFGVAQSSIALEDPNGELLIQPALLNKVPDTVHKESYVEKADLESRKKGRCRENAENIFGKQAVKASGSRSSRYRCCNPFNLSGHQKRRNSLRPVTAWMKEKFRGIGEGARICDSCRKKLTKVVNVDEECSLEGGNVAKDDRDFESLESFGPSVSVSNESLSVKVTPNWKRRAGNRKCFKHNQAKVKSSSTSKLAAVDALNASSEFIHQLSPVRKRKSSDRNCSKQNQGKIDSASNSKTFNTSGVDIQSTDREFIASDRKRGSNEKQYSKQRKQRKIERGSNSKISNPSGVAAPNADSEIIQQLKEKFSLTNRKSEQVTILTLLPKSWSVRKVMNEFCTSQYLVTKARQLVKEKGILSSPNPKPGKSLAPEIVEEVKKFYCSDSISRIMPGKKDFVSAREDGEKKQVQKRMILCNLKDAYSAFKNAFPKMKIGFSKFASLRPRNCVLAGVHRQTQKALVPQKVHDIVPTTGEEPSVAKPCSFFSEAVDDYMLYSSNEIAADRYLTSNVESSEAVEGYAVFPTSEVTAETNRYLTGNPLWNRSASQPQSNFDRTIMTTSAVKYHHV